MKLFVYGSLLNPESAERTLCRRVDPGHSVSAVVDGYRLAWNSIHRIHLSTVGEVNASFLNMVPAPGCRAPGQLIDVDARELDCLCKREKGYSVHGVDCFEASGRRVPAFAFVDGRFPFLDGCGVPSRYLAMVLAGLLSLPVDFVMAYQEALPDPPSLIDGSYHFVDEGQRNAV